MLDTKTKNQIRNILEKVYEAGFMNDKFPTVDVDRLLDSSLLEVQSVIHDYVERRDSNR